MCSNVLSLDTSAATPSSSLECWHDGLLGVHPLALKPSRLWTAGEFPDILASYLSRQFLHVRVQFVQEAVALLEEGVLSVHEGQHLKGKVKNWTVSRLA